jgi:two-component system phosphate regulon sensor histidine kinase PhoR
MSFQIEEELKLIKHTLNQSKIVWPEWCSRLPTLKDVHYSLIKRDGTIVCDSLDKTKIGKNLEQKPELEHSFNKQFFAELKRSDFFGKQAIFADMRLSDDLLIRRVMSLASLRENLDSFDRVLYLRIVPFALISYLVFIFLFYRSTKPLGIILSKVEKFKDDIPFNRSLALLYQRNEWGAIEEALNKADQRLQHQIQEARLENEKSTAILESINDDIIAIDRYETVLFYNSKFQNDFMQNRDGQEINKKIWHYFSDDVLNAFRSVLKAGIPVSLKSISFPKEHSANRFFDLTITPVKASNGIISGALGVFYDVTDFKLTEQMRVDFVANVSHEIRTPLTSIKGFTQILQNQSTKVDSTLHPFLDKIVANTERMISLFNDLLNLSVIESRNYLQFDEFSLPDVVDGVESNILASYSNKKIHFNNDLKLEFLHGDFRLIEQVILNLCDNACKYSENSVEIKISSYERDHTAILSIQDDGPGIAPDHLSRIFERFYRVDASRESSRGTGLGLAIVKQIITKHNGKIRAESNGPGTGTTFIIELPLK